MSDFSKSIEVSAPPETVFAFASDAANLPRYVPTTRNADIDGKGHIHIEGVAHGTEYSDDGQIYVDAERRLMRWGSGETAYRGELVVGGAQSGGSTVAIKLHFNAEKGHVPPAADIERGLAESLDKLRAAIAS